MSERYYADTDFMESPVTLSESETHHLLHVMRQRVGEEVTLFNGCGVEASGRIAEVSRRSATVAIHEIRELPADTQCRVALAIPVPKGDRFRWLVEKAAELGVSRLIPLITDRSVIEPSESRLEKARQTSIAAAKQCGSSHIMEIVEPMTWPKFCENAPRFGTFLIAHPGTTKLFEALQSVEQSAALVIGIGPEGGLTGEEVALAEQSGGKLVALGRVTLRMETAAVAAVACIRLRSD